MNERTRSEVCRGDRAGPSRTHRQENESTLRRCHTAKSSRQASCLLSIASLFVLHFPSFVGGQSLDVVLRGKVSDQTGAGLPGATVTAIDEVTGVVRSAGADREGYFVLPN